MQNHHAVVIDGVAKSFGKKKVLKGVTANIEEGKVVGLLGRNGEGKTTLFKILLDILAADDGHVSILGQEPDGTGRMRGIVGYIPERPTFHEFMRVEEVLKLRSAFFPSWNWSKARDLAKKLSLDLKTPVKGASKGTLAKTAWICATAHNPRVLILDEPTSGLDMVVRESVLSHIVRELSDEGKTILATNHHMEEMLGVLDEIWIMAGGRIESVHTLEQLRQTAFQVTGRLKRGVALPPDLRIEEEHKIGDLVQWLVLDKDSLYRIKQLELLDQMQTEALPLETTFKLLLSKTAEPEN